MLLKNDGGLLPLSPKAKVTFLGPHAKSLTHALNYSLNPSHPHALHHARTRRLTPPKPTHTHSLSLNHSLAHPLTHSPTHSQVAFLGPHANSTLALLGNYHGDNRYVHAHSALMEAKTRGIDVIYEQGCQICDFPYGTSPGYPNMPCPIGKDLNASGMASAIKAAGAADVAVLFVGLDETREAENFDRDGLTLPGLQERLITEVLKIQPNAIPTAYTHTH